jgi:hypothetical protein
MAKVRKAKVVDDKDFGVTHSGAVITEELAEQ